MSEYHMRIVEIKKILDRIEIMVIKDPNNELKKQMLEIVLKRYKKALKGEKV